MGCDHHEDCDERDTFFVVTRRPSDPTDLCAILGFCPAHTVGELAHTGLGLFILFEDDYTHVCASNKAIDEFFEDGHAAKLGILWDVTRYVATPY